MTRNWIMTSCIVEGCTPLLECRKIVDIHTQRMIETRVGQFTMVEQMTTTIRPESSPRSIRQGRAWAGTPRAPYLQTTDGIEPLDKGPRGIDGRVHCYASGLQEESHRAHGLVREPVWWPHVVTVMKYWNRAIRRHINMSVVMVQQKLRWSHDQHNHSYAHDILSLKKTRLG